MKNYRSKIPRCRKLSHFSQLQNVALMHREGLLFLILSMSCTLHRVRILVQVTIYRRLLIGRDGHLDQSEAYDIS